MQVVHMCTPRVCLILGLGRWGWVGSVSSSIFKWFCAAGVLGEQQSSGVQEITAENGREGSSLGNACVCVCVTRWTHRLCMIFA